MNKILESIKNSNYCFLLEIIETIDNDKAYKVIYSNDDFTNIKLVCITQCDIEQLTYAENLIKNFYLDQDYLLGEDFISIKSQSTLQELLYKEGSVIENLSENNLSFFAFLHYVYGKAIFTDLKSLNQDKDGNYCIGDFGCTNFSNINFSKSTMTCYFHIFTEEGLKNCNLVVFNEKTKILEFKPFDYLIKPEDFTDILKASSEVIGTAIARDGTKYLVAHVAFLSIYDNKPLVVSKDLINVAAYIQQLNSNFVSVLDAIVEFIAGKEESHVEWVGGNTSHKTDCAVILESTAINITRKRAYDIVSNIWENYALPVLQGGNLSNEAVHAAVTEIVKQPLSSELLKARSLAAQILMSSTEYTDILNNAIYYRKMYRELNAKAGTYLYYVRCNAFLSKTSLIPWGDNVLRSNFTKAQTLVKEESYYGE